MNASPISIEDMGCVTVSCSIGIATLAPGHLEIRDILAATRGALESGKLRGKNCVAAG